MLMATKEAQNQYQREWMAKRRKAWLDANGPCVQCGSSNRLRVDHIDATQKITHNVWSWSEVRRNKELAKCQVLCHPCHVKKTTLNECLRGEQIVGHKLSEQDVLNARKWYATGNYSFRDIGDHFGVHRDTIRYLVNRWLESYLGRVLLGWLAIGLENRSEVKLRGPTPPFSANENLYS